MPVQLVWTRNMGFFRKLERHKAQKPNVSVIQPWQNPLESALFRRASRTRCIARDVNNSRTSPTHTNSKLTVHLTSFCIAVQRQGFLSDSTKKCMPLSRKPCPLIFFLFSFFSLNFYCCFSFATVEVLWNSSKFTDFKHICYCYARRVSGLGRHVPARVCHPQLRFLVTFVLPCAETWRLCQENLRVGNSAVFTQT
jgi:hypothetical protein